MRFEKCSRVSPLQTEYSTNIEMHEKSCQELTRLWRITDETKIIFKKDARIQGSKIQSQES